MRNIQQLQLGAAIVAAMLLAACGGGGGGGSANIAPSLPTTAPATATPVPTPAATQVPWSPLVPPQNGIYVGGGQVDANNNLSNFYLAYYPSATSTAPTKTVPLGNRQPWQMAEDMYGYLYVPNEDITKYVSGKTAVVDVYAPGGTTPVRTLQTGLNIACAVAVDKSGTVYVAGGCLGNDTGQIQVYANGATTPTKVITSTLRGPGTLALDSQGNLYMSDYVEAAIEVLPRGASSVQILRLHDAYAANSIAFDPQGDLTANAGTLYTFTPSELTASQSTIVSASTVTQLQLPPDPANVISMSSSFLTYGADGTLYVANPWGFTTDICHPGNFTTNCKSPGFIEIFPPGLQSAPTFIENVPVAYTIAVWPQVALP